MPLHRRTQRSQYRGGGNKEQLAKFKEIRGRFELKAIVLMNGSDPDDNVIHGTICRNLPKK
ncbi:MAG: hypothetical protein R2874_07665 [Desulfobacterales bacterium]